MFNLTSSVPKSWQTVSRQADRATNETAATTHAAHQPPPRELGDVLRERREAMGASLAEVETATRIRQKYLAALESDEWHLLPGEVVGRGFLRNYATYLGLDPTEVVERRRAVADPLLSAALSGTSAGSDLPPERDVDYRPKDVLLKDEPEGIQQREIRVGPFLTVVTVLGVLLLVWWGIRNFGSELGVGLGSMVAAAQTRIEARNSAVSTPLPGELARDELASSDLVPISTSEVNASDTNTGISRPAGEGERIVGSDTVVNQPIQAGAPDQNPPAQPTTAVATVSAPVTILIPTDTPTTAPTVAVPTNTLEPPTPTPTETPLPAPTDTPLVPTETPLPAPTDTPAPPAVVAPFCADDRMAFFTPGVGQVLNGAVSITGRAVHENLDYYKLEYAVGTNAEGGFVYFDGSKGQVDGGILGTLNTGSLPNGEYTLQLTIVDLTGNYPPPCRVSIVIQN
ncbi:MAG: helix-turn-helix transcriptional regulator [Caldilineaceae bacterium]